MKNTSQFLKRDETQKIKKDEIHMNLNGDGFTIVHCLVISLSSFLIFL